MDAELGSFDVTLHARSARNANTARPRGPEDWRSTAVAEKTWYRWRLGRLAYAPGIIDTQGDTEGSWIRLFGPWFWRYMTWPKST
jgi:hypothetical protein